MDNNKHKFIYKHLPPLLSPSGHTMYNCKYYKRIQDLAIMGIEGVDSLSYIYNTKQGEV